MPAITSAQSKIQDLQAQIALLKDTATKELLEKRTQISQELHVVDAEIARLTGKSLEQQKGKRQRSAIVGRTPSLVELKDLLSAVPGKTLNLRREGIDAKHVKGLVASNPGVFTMGGKGAWPEITLVR